MVKNIKSCAIVGVAVLISTSTFAASKHEIAYEKEKRFNFGSFSVESLEKIEPTKTQEVDGVEMFYYDADEVKKHPFSRGHHPQTTLLIDKDKTMALYNAKFKTQEDCISDLGKRELKSYYYKSYRTRAVKSSPKSTKWKVTTRTVDESGLTNTVSEVKVEINPNDYEMVGDFQTLKAYFNPLYPKHAGSFEQPVEGDFYVEMECKVDGSAKLLFKDVYRNEALKK
ncbi:hypothetical protein [Vibrio sp. 10N.261.46.A3]|uniref:hypothetical protein n=1 Tax=Vibrio sp. 10N.261.46.A3 TaxID=3229658 RepID=UPI00354F5748